MRREPRSGDVLTVAQLAEYLQLHKLTVYKYIREGKIPAVRIGRIIRIRAEEVGLFLQAQQTSVRRRAQVIRPREEEIQVGPQQPERTLPREAVVTGNPLDWVIRGLH